MSKITESYDVQLALTPTSGSVAVTGSVVNGIGFDTLVYVVTAHCASTATVDLTFQNAPTAAFTTGSAACTASSGSVACTQITASNDDTVWLVEVPVLSTKPYQRMVATAATADAIVSAVAMGEGGNHAKAPTQDNTIAKI